MGVYVAQRVVAAAPTLAGVALVVFALVRLLPGDPARLMAGPLASEEEIEQLRGQLGLGEPLPVQLAAFFGRLMVGDLGRSARTGGAVLDEIVARLPYTLELAAISIVLATAFPGEHRGRRPLRLRRSADPLRLARARPGAGCVSTARRCWGSRSSPPSPSSERSRRCSRRTTRRGSASSTRSSPLRSSIPWAPTSSAGTCSRGCCTERATRSSPASVPSP